MSGPTEAEVRGWITDLEADARRVESELTPLLERQSALEERLGILRRLLASVSTDSARGQDNGASGAAGSDGERLGSVRERVIRDAVEILTATSGPMHINDLHAEFIKRGYEVPGAGKPVNITVHLSGTDAIASPSRGNYVLAAHAARPLRQAVRDDSRKRAGG